MRPGRLGDWARSTLRFLERRGYLIGFLAAFLLAFAWVCKDIVADQLTETERAFEAVSREKSQSQLTYQIAEDVRDLMREHADADRNIGDLLRMSTNLANRLYENDERRKVDGRQDFHPVAVQTSTTAPTSRATSAPASRPITAPSHWDYDNIMEDAQAQERPMILERRNFAMLMEHAQHLADAATDVPLSATERAKIKATQQLIVTTRQQLDELAERYYRVDLPALKGVRKDNLDEFVRINDAFVRESSKLGAAFPMHQNEVRAEFENVYNVAKSQQGIWRKRATWVSNSARLATFLATALGLIAAYQEAKAKHREEERKVRQRHLG